MLKNLSISNFLLIDNLEIEFISGLCVLTGETGSGKSILVDAIGLMVGMRGGAEYIQTGFEQCSISGEFEIDLDDGTRHILVENGIDIQSQLILRRVLNLGGRSRAFINDVPVSVGLLRQVGGRLIEIHNQFDIYGLLDPANHQSILDEYAKLQNIITKTAKQYRSWRKAKETLSTRIREYETLKDEEELLIYTLKELNEIEPKKNEEEELTSRRKFLMSSEELRTVINDIFKNLEDTNGINDNLRSNLGQIEKVLDKSGGKLDVVYSALERSIIETNEAATELENLIDSLDAEPGELELVEDRLFALKSLARKHSITVDELSDLQARLETQINDLGGIDSKIGDLEKEVEKRRQDFQETAQNLTKARKKASKKLGGDVTDELGPLKLGSAQFVVSADPLQEKEWSEKGCERIEFLVKTNPNTQLGPIHKVASGGELARLMLALKVCLAGAKSPGTIIFDEVDSGIGGATASAVGERLLLLSKNTQVLVVTHSPQVTAKATMHWNVAKSENSQYSKTILRNLDDDQRKEEIARMLSGEKITEEARAAAEKLIFGGGNVNN